MRVVTGSLASGSLARGGVGNVEEVMLKLNTKKSNSWIYES